MIKNGVFWDVPQFGFNINRRFGRKCLVHLQETRHVPPKRQFIINSHGGTSQKAPFFIVAAINTPNPTGIKKFIYVTLTRKGEQVTNVRRSISAIGGRAKGQKEGLVSRFLSHPVYETQWPESASELYRLSDRHLSTKLVPTFCG
jgi:hypothetical protein